jgi:hypothetical protein
MEPLRDYENAAEGDQQSRPGPSAAPLYNASGGATALYQRSSSYNNGGDNNGTGNGNGGNFANATLTQRAVEVVTAAAAQLIVDMYRPGSTNAQAGCQFVSSSTYSVWHNLQQICGLNFQVKITLLSADEDLSGTSKRVVMYGQAENLTAVSEIMRQCDKASKTVDTGVNKKQLNALRNLQGVVLTQDWRFRIDSATVDAPNAAKTAFDRYVMERLVAMPLVEGALPVEHLPVGITAASSLLGTPAVVVNADSADHMRRTLIAHMQGLTARLGFTTQTSLQAVMLLIRYLRFIPTFPAKENLSILAAIAVMVAKCGADFKYKMVSTIIHSAYCQVFNRNESDVSVDSIEPYIQPCLEKEHAIYGKVHNDLFSADIGPIFQSFVRAGMYGEKWLFEHDAALNGMDVEGASSEVKDKHRDREAEHAKRKKIATYQHECGIRNTVRRSVLNSAECLAQELLCLRSVASPSNGAGGSSTTAELSVSSALSLCAIPIELLQISALLYVCELYRQLPSGSQHRRVASELTTLLSELSHLATDVLSLSPALLQWCIELIAEAALEFLPNIDYIECFRELREALPVETQVHTLRVLVPQGIVQLNSASGVVVPGGVSDAAGRILAAVGAASHLSRAAGSSAGVPTAGAVSSAPCKSRFPWLATEGITSADGAVIAPNAVYLEYGASITDLARGGANSAAQKTPIVACAKVTCPVQCKPAAKNTLTDRSLSPFPGSVLWPGLPAVRRGEIPAVRRPA